MKRMLVLLLACVVAPGLAGAAPFYYNVDSVVGGPMDMTFLGADTSLPGDGSMIVTYHLRGTNTSGVTLTDVGFTHQFVYSESAILAYDNAQKEWRTDPLWTVSYGLAGQTNLLSMDRTVTDVPLTWNGATLLATDDVTVMPLAASIPPGGSADFDFVVQHSDLTRDWLNTGFFISTVPEPATMGLLAFGALLPLFRKKRK